jgi:lysylphosphatidylglycerol synthetase-like protein (DUF2156 family)
MRLIIRLISTRVRSWDTANSTRSNKKTVVNTTASMIVVLAAADIAGMEKGIRSERQRAALVAACALLNVAIMILLHHCCLYYESLLHSLAFSAALLLRGYNSNFAGTFNISFAYFEDTPPDKYLSTPIKPKITFLVC